MESIVNFLTLNGFFAVSFPSDNILKNDKCTVEISICDDCYGVTTPTGTTYSNGLSIYWLIGFLTYNDLMNKNYRMIKKRKK